MEEGPAKWRFLQSRWAGRQAGTSCLQTLERPRPVRGWQHPSTVDPGPGGSASDRGHGAQPRPCGRRGRRWQWALPAAGQGRACTPLPTPHPRPPEGVPATASVNVLPALLRSPRKPACRLVGSRVPLAT